MLNRIGSASLLPMLMLGAVACGNSGSPGKSEGESCTGTAECQSGYRCISLVCSLDETQDVEETDWGEVRLPDCFPDCPTPESITWITIPGGTFQMGCSQNDDLCEESEKPRHAVTLTGFQMLETEVTQAQFAEVMHYDPSCNWAMGGGPDSPVECVDWLPAKAFCVAIGGRLPTEAEWEYAARGGTETRYYCGDDPACLGESEWLGGEWPPGKHAVGQKKPNPYGLYDMVGNVYEWINDWFAEDYYKYSPERSPSGPNDGTRRALRGSCFLAEEEQYAGYFRSSFRAFCHPQSGDNYIGFRCAK